MTNNVWTGSKGLARRNEYDATCVACGLRVHASLGRLVSTHLANGTPLNNGVLHIACDLPRNGEWIFRARIGSGVRVDIALAVLRDEGLIDSGPTPVEPTPGEPAPAGPREPTEAELTKAVSDLLNGITETALGKVPALVRDTLLELTRTVEIKVGKAAPAIKVSNAHPMLADVVMCVVAGVSPFLVGPAGSGKTTLASQVCDVLKRKFYAENRVTSEYKLLGYMDATGKYVRTQFREAFEKGGGFLLDEVDASDPDVLTTFNSALANRICPFPDKMVRAHPEFFAIAAGNTFGRGADRQYVGRNQLDAATLDRFAIFVVDYDEQVELAWATNDDWTLYVQQVRKAIADENVRHIISPRASIYGALLLAAGMDRAKVVESCIWKGLDTAQRARVEGRLA